MLLCFHVWYRVTILVRGSAQQAGVLVCAFPSWQQSEAKSGATIRGNSPRLFVCNYMCKRVECVSKLILAADYVLSLLLTRF